MTDIAENRAEAGLEKSTVVQAKEKVQETAQEGKARAGSRLREEFDARSTQAGEQVSSIAGALRRASEQLRTEGGEGPAKLVDQAARQSERLSTYLKDARAGSLLADVEGFARRQPWVMAIAAFGVGLVSSRFLKASSSRGQGSVSSSFDGRGHLDPPMYSTGPVPDSPSSTIER